MTYVSVAINEPIILVAPAGQCGVGSGVVVGVSFQRGEGSNFSLFIYVN